MSTLDTPDEVDLLVLGGGVAGLATALVAAIEGLSVLVCEKSSQFGGTAATSAGTVWVPGSRQAEAAGLADPVEWARAYLAAEIDESGGGADTVGQRLRATYLATGPRVLDYLEQHSHVHFTPAVRHPDYHDEHPGAAIGGRALVARPFDGRRLGADFARLRPPMASMMVLGGMSVAKDDVAPLLAPWSSWRAFGHAASLLLRHARDRLVYPRGTRLVMGNALIARLMLSLRERGVPLMSGVHAMRLHRAAGGRVEAATIAHAGGTRVVRARRGVVLACGGFAHGTAWRRQWLPQAANEAHTPSLMFEGNTGDGLDLATAVGAVARADGHATPAFWVPTSAWTECSGGQRSWFPHFALDRAKPGLIAVNAAGRRFVNEADSYHDFVLGMYRSHRSVPTLPAWLVCDAVFVRRYGLGRIRPGGWGLAAAVRRGDVLSAPTLAQLAAGMHVDAAGLADSVARNNRFAASGVDEDFGRGRRELNRFNGDSRQRPNPCLGPIGRAPFYAVAVWPADAGMSAGLVTDANARVLDAHGDAVEGLYACGADMASIMRGRYPGPGVTLGPALVFGWRAAMHAAGRAAPPAR
ncbi:MAG: FAD-dependent oxidoreductase [Burkholderiales bacterium]|nr:FAD-dependent oxidoreductase [Burkholderiales bacterium]